MFIGNNKFKSGLTRKMTKANMGGVSGRNMKKQIGVKLQNDVKNLTPKRESSHPNTPHPTEK